MYYNCAGIDRLLCIDVEKVSQALADLENVDIVFALANSDKYGGAGYVSPSLATLSARNPASTELALHEIGHSFGGLSDEYEASGVDVVCDNYENSSALEASEMLAQKSKWFRWLDLPNIGTFKGSCYSQNFFRPTNKSKMRALNNPYEEVNTEQLIKQIYEKVKPVDSWQKNENSDGNLELKIQILQPVETPLVVKWFVDGQLLETLSNTIQINTRDLNLNSGTHNIKAEITDSSPRVRDEEFRKTKMSQSLQWSFMN